MKNKNKKYLFYITLSYSYCVLRPIEYKIKERGGSVAWFLPEGSEAEKFLLPSDIRLKSVKEVKSYDADATLAPGNYIPDFFPGIKVQVFHGFDSGKKNKFNIRGFFDLYCTQGPNITNAFKKISDGSCEIIETGWSKLDPLFSVHHQTEHFKDNRPIIFYAPTFSQKLTSTEALFPYIKALAEKRNWQWLIKLHPKAKPEEVALYKGISSDNLRFVETGDIIPLLQVADVILSDTSSVLAEFALQEKVVVAFNNRRPEPWMLNFQQENELEKMLDLALTKPDEMIVEIDKHCREIHPYTDGRSSERVLNAVEELVDKGTEHLKAKPLNLFRRLKMRKKLKYYHWA